MTICDKLITHRQEILAIAARNGARNVRVFGSVARGDADAMSDIDFLVDMEAGTQPAGSRRPLDGSQGLAGL